MTNKVMDTQNAIRTGLGGIMLDELILRNNNKIIFLILDGLGDIPNPTHSYLTPLEAAKKPNIDALALEKGVLGRIMPVGVGITPGSGPGHLSLFGYDPVQCEIGRGILEVLGLNMGLQANDLAARGNFCTISDGKVTDRRAGRIETSVTVRLCDKIRREVPSIDDATIIIEPGKSHRFAVIFRGQGLSDALEDADPHKDGKPFLYAQAKSVEADHSAAVINGFLKRVQEVLKDEPVANGALLRGFSRQPDITPFSTKYGMDALAIATYPMYRGIAKVLGMKVEKEPKDYAEMTDILKEHYDRYQFFFMHIKETDVAGEDGDFEGKVKAIEDVDKIVPAIYAMNPQALVITGDHSTPCPMKGHSWHPVPVLIVTNTGERDNLSFHEGNCLKGSVGTIYSRELMSLALAHGLRLDKYGA
jgi:2,3-bisphosphoglycerate-independent phosphoglycerate mutase